MLQHIDRPPVGDSVGALVFFHGYSGDPADLVAFLNKIDPERRFHGYLPQAPHPGEGSGASSFNRGSSDPEEKQIRHADRVAGRSASRASASCSGVCRRAPTSRAPSGSAPATPDQQGSSRLRAGSATTYRQTWNDRCRQSQSPTAAPTSRSRSVSPDTRGTSLNARARPFSTGRRTLVMG